MGVEFEHISSACLDPLGRYGDEAENEFFEPEGGLQPPNALRVEANDVAIEVGNDRRKDHKGCVFRQERTRQL